MGFDWAYGCGSPAWDIDRPQPVFVALVERGLIAGSVVDAGRGTGENALYLASLGLSVTGVDAAPTAIVRANAKASARGLAAAFVVADALGLGWLGRTFDVVIDSGLFHVFSDEQRLRYVLGLGDVLHPGGRCFLLCFSDRQPGAMGPRRVSQAEIRDAFTGTDGWRMDSIVATHFATHDPAGGPRAPHAWLAALTRLPQEV